MIKRKADRLGEIKSNLRGGVGDLAFSHLFSSEELSGKARMFAEVTLKQGESIGVHEHNEEGEVYIVSKGTATVTDNGEEYTLLPGDAMWTTGGDTHSIENKEKEPLVIFAIIL